MMDHFSSHCVENVIPKKRNVLCLDNMLHSCIDLKCPLDGVQLKRSFLLSFQEPPCSHSLMQGVRMVLKEPPYVVLQGNQKPFKHKCCIHEKRAESIQDLILKQQRASEGRIILVIPDLALFLS
ncbi:hypothetical protein CHARACLAT_014099 [Characodon lateralis]|uniref:Uncharacterized protein n=1 Tax=Characodon lateralis TaxID=208331 RepID=A0ABU7EV36_9TELE|nr:hypothetical protein [Characodon lateralis]